MAKMFYTLDEAKAALGKNEEEIKQYTREGRLREFRDGPRLMYKADQVEALKAELAGGDPVDIGASDSGMAIGLADSKGIGSGLGSGLGSGIGSGIGSGTGSGIGSGVGSGVGSGLSGSGSGLSLVDTDAGHGASPGGSAGGMSLKEDTALAADLGLSGSIGGVPSPAGRPSSATGTGLSGSQGSRPGVDVFQNDEVERVDPSAQTAIAPGISEIASEGVGSGSGLLDLTRESDDTSLGAELLDEIAPGGTATGRRHVRRTQRRRNRRRAKSRRNPRRTFRRQPIGPKSRAVQCRRGSRPHGPRLRRRGAGRFARRDFRRLCPGFRHIGDRPGYSSKCRQIRIHRRRRRRARRHAGLLRRRLDHRQDDHALKPTSNPHDFPRTPPNAQRRRGASRCIASF